TSQDEKKTDYGVIKIHKNVIVQIASLAAMEVEGVSKISMNFFTEFLKIITKGKIVKYPVKIELRDNNEVTVSIPLVVNYGINIPNVAANVQENVKKAIEKMTGLYPADIHIKIKGVEVK
ncbi:MAG: Asp23/Gls24 family envelope stress response protein, partial [Candidatus Omnitrophica bacterium]|nr:Asp23/Gls24 family envelope stress response protein [Candidatus Omnitrophota bacterium]